MRLTPRFVRLMNFYPPFLGAGIRVSHVSENLRTITVELRLRTWNMNYMGTQFGGSLYAFTDPWYCLILIAALGEDFNIWDKAALIRFRRPGRGKVTARFHLTEERLQEIKTELDEHQKAEPVFRVEVLDEDGLLVSEVEKTISIRRRKDR